ncbi:hypothetical protein RYX36_013374 [Vicia faba]
MFFSSPPCSSFQPQWVSGGVAGELDAGDGRDRAAGNNGVEAWSRGEDDVHIIDLDIMQGLQWPGFFHILPSRSRKIRSVRITGFGSSSELLESTGRRLAHFASSLGLPFEFHPVEGKIGSVTEPSQLGVRPNETILVHWMHHCLYDITGSDLGTSRLLTQLRPKLITTV